MQEQKDEGSKEAPKAVPYILCYTMPALPKPPIQVGSHPVWLGRIPGRWSCQV